jgi:hypothetical protein
MLGSQGGIVLPFSSSFHESEEEAKKNCLEQMGILDSDWIVAEGEPEWAAGFNEAILDAISEDTSATSDEAEEST